MAPIDMLKASILEEIRGAESEEHHKRWKNALILYSKALFSLCDYLIEQHRLKLPKDHRERFLILQRHLPPAYMIVDRVFRTYVDTYIKPSDREGCAAMCRALWNIGNLEAIDQEIETALAAFKP